MFRSCFTSATQLFKKIMRPRKISVRRTKPAARAEALPAATNLTLTPYHFTLAPKPGKPLNATLLRIGDYLLGEPDCPSLYGHPGIRY